MRLGDVDALTTWFGPDAQVTDSGEFDDFYRATWARLFRTAYAVAGDVGSAEDALQSAYARAYASWRRVRSADHPEAYVRRIVVNELISERRRGWWRRERPTDLPPDSDAHPPADDRVAERDALWSAILDLPVRQRAVVVLRYYEDLSEAAIAEVLRCSRGTVKSQASAALDKLRRHADLVNGDL